MRGYADGALQVWGQSGYVARVPASDLAFRVIGEQELTEQMAAIVAGCGQFLAGCEVRETSGVAGPMYREGTATGRAELGKLLGYGTDDGGRLLATVRRERVLEIRNLTPSPLPLRGTQAVPTREGEAEYRLQADGRVCDALGGEVPAGVCPVGCWVALAGAPGNADVSLYGRVTPFFAERAGVRVPNAAAEAGAGASSGGLGRG